MLPLLSPILLLAITGAYAFLLWYRMPVALTILFALLPTYLIRTQIGPIPTTLLELLLLTTILIGAWQYQTNIQTALRHVWRHAPYVCIGTILFLLGASIGVMTSVDMRTALGEWKAFYIEPVLFATVLFVALRLDVPLRKAVLSGITISVVSIILFTLFQILSGGMFVPDGFWASDGTFRATAWYGFPNGVGIMLGLSCFLVLSYIHTTVRSHAHTVAYTFILFLTTGIALIAARSSGAIIGLLGGAVLLLAAHARTRIPTIMCGAVTLIVFLLLPLSHPVKQELFLQDRSGQIRTHMWAEAWQMLLDRPILGAGMASYEERVVPYHTTVNGEGIEIFHHPHNIWLTLWANTGMIGVLGFAIVYFSVGFIAIRDRQWYLFAALISFFLMGLVDSPYIKNDWAILFWTIVVIILTHKKTPAVSSHMNE